jgi:hypothetical protein
MKARNVNNCGQKKWWGSSHKQKFLFINGLACTVLWAQEEEGREHQSMLSNSKTVMEGFRRKYIVRDLDFEFLGTAEIEG